MKDKTLDQESASARAREGKEPKPDGFCFNCGNELHEGCFCPGFVCRREWERFQRKP
jgi:hypothetical protein